MSESLRAGALVTFFRWVKKQAELNAGAALLEGHAPPRAPDRNTRALTGPASCGSARPRSCDEWDEERDPEQLDLLYTPRCAEPSSSATRRALLPVRPRPFADECLPSWIARLAAANGLTLGEFTTHVGFQPTGLVHGRTCWDWLGCTEARCDPRLHALASSTGVGVRHVAALTLSEVHRRLTREWHAGPRAPAPGAGADDELGLGTADGHRRHAFVTRTQVRSPRPAGRPAAARLAYAYCPACLGADEVPYFRRAWSLAYVAACPVHGVLLRDECARCGMPAAVAPAGGARARPALSRVTHCAECGTRRSDALPASAGPDLTEAAAEAVATARRGWGVVDGNVVSSARYFARLHAVLDAVTLAGLGRSAGLDADTWSFVQATESVPGLVESNAPAWFSELAPQERAPFLAATWAASHIRTRELEAARLGARNVHEARLTSGGMPHSGAPAERPAPDRAAGDRGALVLDRGEERGDPTQRLLLFRAAERRLLAEYEDRLSKEPGDLPAGYSARDLALTYVECRIDGRRLLLLP